MRAPIVVIALASAPLLLEAQAPVLLRLTPAAGQVSRYQTVMRMFMTMPGMPPGDSSQPTMRQCMQVTQTVDSATGEAFVVRSVTDSMRMEMPGMPGALPANVQSMMQGMVVTTRLDARGRILETSVTGGNLPPSATGGLTGAMGGLTSRLPGLPEQAVRPGDSWTDSQSVSVAVQGAPTSGWVRITSRLDSLVGGADSLAVVSAGGSASYTMSSAEMAMNVSGTSAGQVVWDLRRGRLARLSTTSTGEIVATAIGMTMPFRMTMTMALLGAAPTPATSCR